jgi:hypothetical protein
MTEHPSRRRTALAGMTMRPTPDVTPAQPISLDRCDALDAYDEAVVAVCRNVDPIPALRRAVGADPTFAPAVADLSALTATPAPTALTAGSRWERQHVEIVRIAPTDPARAEALLREHAATYGCDPLALLVVARHVGGVHGDRLTDLRGTACSCWT